MSAMEPIVLVGGPSDGAEHTIDPVWLQDCWPQFHLSPEPELSLSDLDGRGGEKPIRYPRFEHYELLRDPYCAPSRDDMGRLRFGFRGQW